MFVADVTPVSIIKRRRKTAGNGDEGAEKRNMNPNVAIELGFAMRKVTDLNVLMVLNTHYGGRQYLPFDLAHKAGPICYELAPGADKAERERVAAGLRGDFVQALRPYIAAPEMVSASSKPAFRAVPSTASAAVYFKANEVLGRLGITEDNYQYVYSGSNGFYLRLQPTTMRNKPIPSQALFEEIRRSALWPFWTRHSSLASVNDAGAIVFEPIDAGAGGPLKALTQVFKNGEVWGLANWLFVENQFGKLIAARDFETVYRSTLARYASFLATNLKIDPPYLMVAGAVGLKGYDVALDLIDNRWHIADDEFVVERQVSVITEPNLDAAVLAISEGLFELTGYPRPPGSLGWR